jgi:hypothetical protein
MTSYQQASRLCSLLGLVSHSFPPVEELKFGASGPILVLLLCGLEDNGIIGSIFPMKILDC